MTYKQMTKEIDLIGEQINFLYKIRKELFKGRIDEESMIGNIVNNLCAYQNYLKFGKEYEDRWLAESMVRQAKRENAEQKKKGKWTYDVFGNAWCSNCHHIGALPTEELSRCCPNCGSLNKEEE